MSKKKICFIAQFPPPIHGLSKAVDTLYNSKLADEFKFEKIDITNNRNIIKNLNLIRKSNADLFYFTISQTKGGNFRDLLILKLLDIQKKKCLIHLHGGYYRHLVDYDMSFLQRKANYKAVNKLIGSIVLGPSLKPIFQGMMPDSKIYTVPNCVDDEFLISIEDLRKKVETLNQRSVKHILYLSNFIRTKGYFEILEMARLEKERVEAGNERRFYFDFAGKFFEKTEEDYFWNYIKENELEEYVAYHGVVGGKKKRELLKKCDIFVLLTRYPNEGQPISILEAMGNGMVVLTTDHAGIPDIVENKVNGIVINKSFIDAKQCYNMILNQSEDAMQAIIQRNIRKVNNTYSQDNYVKNMQIIFENL